MTRFCQHFALIFLDFTRKKYKLKRARLSGVLFLWAENKKIRFYGAESMNILGYIGFAVLILMAVTLTIRVRVILEAGIFTCLNALFYVSSVVFVGVSGTNKLHSWWIVPFGFVFLCCFSPVFMQIFCFAFLF